MSLLDSLTHTVTIKGPPTATRDSSGGTNNTWPVTKLANVPCIINTASSSEVERFAQMGMQVSHTVSFRTSALTTAMARGDKIIADDTSENYHVEGISAGRAMGGIEAFVYAHCSQLL